MYFVVVFWCNVYSDEVASSASVLLEAAQRSRVVELLVLHVSVSSFVLLSFFVSL